MPRTVLVAAALAALLLTGCDVLTGALGIESPEKAAAAREAEGKAVGGACRHAGRAIEDCYALNKKADKASVYVGWREMSEYMRENKLEPVLPVIPIEPPKPPKSVPSAPADGEAADEPPAAKPAAKKKAAH